MFSAEPPRRFPTNQHLRHPRCARSSFASRLSRPGVAWSARCPPLPGGVPGHLDWKNHAHAARRRVPVAGAARHPWLRLNAAHNHTRKRRREREEQPHIRGTLSPRLPHHLELVRRSLADDTRSVNSALLRPPSPSSPAATSLGKHTAVRHEARRGSASTDHQDRRRPRAALSAIPRWSSGSARPTSSRTVSGLFADSRSPRGGPTVAGCRWPSASSRPTAPT